MKEKRSENPAGKTEQGRPRSRFLQREGSQTTRGKRAPVAKINIFITAEKLEKVKLIL